MPPKSIQDMKKGPSKYTKKLENYVLTLLFFNTPIQHMVVKK